MKPVNLTQFFTRMLWNIGRSPCKKALGLLLLKSVDISYTHECYSRFHCGWNYNCLRKSLALILRFVESVWPAEYKNQKDYRGFQNSLYFPPMRRFQRYPKFADRKIQKILRFTGFFNLLKSSAQSSEYLFKKLKIVSWSVFFDIAVLQLITAKESAHKAEVVLSWIAFSDFA